MNKLDELKKHIAQASELLLESADPFDRACTIISELQAELDKLEQEQQPWPQVGDKYSTIDYDGQTVLSVWDDDEFDHYRLSTGNCFRTKTEALAYREWQTDPRVVARGVIERMEGFDFNGLGAIAMHDQVTPRAYQYKDALPNGGLRFTDEDVASLVVDKHLDLCKVALGAITDKEEAGRIVRLAIGKVQSVNGQEAMRK